MKYGKHGKKWTAILAAGLMIMHTLTGSWGYMRPYAFAEEITEEAVFIEADAVTADAGEADAAMPGTAEAAAGAAETENTADAETAEAQSAEAQSTQGETDTENKEQENAAGDTASQEQEEKPAEVHIEEPLVGVMADNAESGETAGSTETGGENPDGGEFQAPEQSAGETSAAETGSSAADTGASAAGEEAEKTKTVNDEAGTAENAEAGKSDEPETGKPDVSETGKTDEPETGAAEEETVSETETEEPRYMLTLPLADDIVYTYADTEHISAERTSQEKMVLLYKEGEQVVLEVKAKKGFELLFEDDRTCFRKVEYAQMNSSDDLETGVISISFLMPGEDLILQPEGREENPSEQPDTEEALTEGSPAGEKLTGETISEGMPAEEALTEGMSGEEALSEGIRMEEEPAEEALTEEAPIEDEIVQDPETDEQFINDFPETPDWEDSSLIITFDANHYDIQVLGTYSAGKEAYAMIRPQAGYKVIGIGVYQVSDLYNMYTGNIEDAVSDEIPVNSYEEEIDGAVTFSFTMPDDMVVLFASVREENRIDPDRKIGTGISITSADFKFEDYISGTELDCYYPNSLLKDQFKSQGLATFAKPYNLTLKDGSSYKLFLGYCMQASQVFPGTYSDGEKKSTLQSIESILKDGRRKTSYNSSTGEWNYKNVSASEKKAWETLLNGLYLLTPNINKDLFSTNGLWGRDFVIEEKGKQVTKNFKTIYEDYGLTSAKEQYAMSHMVMSYLYWKAVGEPSSWDWDGGGYADGTKTDPEPKDVLNDTGVKFVREVADILEKAVNIDAVLLRGNTAGDSFSKEECTVGADVMSSPTFTWSSIPANSVKFTGLPGSMKIYDETAGKYTATIAGGHSFHIEAPLSAGGDSIALTGTAELFTAGTAYYSLGNEGSDKNQDLGLAATSKKTKVSLTGEFPESGVKIYIHKKADAAYTDLVAGNEMYGYNAVFTLFNKTSSYEFSCDVTTGVSQTLEVLPGDYTLRETQAPAGFTAGADKKVTVTAQTDHFDFEDVPVYGTLELAAMKETDERTDISLAGAEFQLQFFGNASGTGTPLRTWTFRTDSDGSAPFDAAHKVSGDELYMVGQTPVIPLGCIICSETKAPEGLLISTDVPAIQIRNGASGAVIENAPSRSGKGTYEIPEFGGVIVDKSSIEQGKVRDGDAKFDAEFTVRNENSYSVGVGRENSIAEFAGKKFAPGADLFVLQADPDTGIASTDTRFGTKYVLQAGTYSVRETKAPTGMKISQKVIRFTVSDDGEVVDLRQSADTDSRTFANEVIRGGFHVEKQDAELVLENCAQGGRGVFEADHTFGANGAQGDAVLAGAEFTLINRSESSVRVDGEVYQPGDTICVFTTDEKNSIRTPDDYLPYGTYELTETKAPEGYKLEGVNLSIRFLIREDGQNLDLKGTENVRKDQDNVYIADEPVRFDVRLLKFKAMPSEMYNQGDTWEDDGTLEALAGVDFQIILKSTGKVYATITTDKEGTASTVSKDYPHGRLPYGIYTVHEVEETIPEGIAAIPDFEIDGTKTGDVYDGRVYSGQGLYKVDDRIDAWIELLKVDGETGRAIPLQAEFEIHDKNHQPVELNVSYPRKTTISRFTTDQDGLVSLPQRLPYGTYYLHEVKAPDGYLWAEDREFKVTERNSWLTTVTWTFADEPAKGVLEIEKTDARTGESVNGAEFAVYAAENIVTGDGTQRYSEGEHVDTIVIGAAREIGSGASAQTLEKSGTGYSGELYLGRYYAVETRAPGGYVTDTKTRYDFTLSYEGQKDYAAGSEPPRYERMAHAYAQAVNEPTYLEILKSAAAEENGTWIEAKDGQMLDGAVFEIHRIGGPEDPRPDNGNVQLPDGAYTTGNGGRIPLSRIPSGLYSVKETGAPAGYIVDPVTTYFLVDEEGFICEASADGVPISGKAGSLELRRKNLYTRWEFSKTDLGGTEIEGASMQIIDAEGKIRYEWTSGKTPYRINQIPEGSYVLHEEAPAKGYVVASDIPFTVTATDVLCSVSMTDAPITVEISKKDLSEGEGSAEVPGAAIEIRDSSGELVESWVSGPEPHRIEALPAGVYTLTETGAPDGYEYSETVTFTVKETAEIQKCIMYDAPFRDVEISKYEMVKGEGRNELEGAKMQILDAEGKVVDQWVSGRKPHRIKLASGTYTLTEILAPDGYATAETVTFTVRRRDNGDHEVQKVEMKNRPTRVKITKDDITDGKPVIGATLIIKDAKGKEIARWKTKSKPHYIEKLPVGKYTLTELTAPKGYQMAETVKFKVKDTSEIQKVVMHDEPLPEPDGKRETETDTEIRKPGGNPKTGDPRKPGGLLLLLAAAFTAAAADAAVIVRRKRRQQIRRN